MIPIKSKIKIIIDCIGIEKGIYIMQNPFSIHFVNSNADLFSSFFLYDSLFGGISTDSFPELCIWSQPNEPKLALSDNQKILYPKPSNQLFIQCILSEPPDKNHA